MAYLWLFHSGIEVGRRFSVTLGLGEEDIEDCEQLQT